MSRIFTLVDEDGRWWDNNPHPLGSIIVLENELIISPASTPKLSQRLRIAVRVLRRRKNATEQQELERGK